MHSSIISYFCSAYVLSSVMFVVRLQPALHCIYITAIIFVCSCSPKFFFYSFIVLMFPLTFCSLVFFSIYLNILRIMHSQFTSSAVYKITSASFKMYISLLIHNNFLLFLINPLVIIRPIIFFLILLYLSNTTYYPSSWVILIYFTH